MHHSAVRARVVPGGGLLGFYVRLKQWSVVRWTPRAPRRMPRMPRAPQTARTARRAGAPRAPRAVLYDTVKVSCKTGEFFSEILGVASPGALAIPGVSWGN